MFSEVRSIALSFWNILDYSLKSKKYVLQQSINISNKFFENETSANILNDSSNSIHEKIDSKLNLGHAC
jgi:hypothetical protein